MQKQRKPWVQKEGVAGCERVYGVQDDTETGSPHEEKRKNNWYKGWKQSKGIDGESTGKGGFAGPYHLMSVLERDIHPCPSLCGSRCLP